MGQSYRVKGVYMEQVGQGYRLKEMYMDMWDWV